MDDDDFDLYEAPKGGFAYQREGEFDPYTGVQTNYHFQDNELITEKLYDPEPLLREAAEARAHNAGGRWRDTHRVGSIPMAVLSGFMSRGLQGDDLDNAIMQWFRENPLMAHDDKLRKDHAPNRKIIV